MSKVILMYQILDFNTKRVVGQSPKNYPLRTFSLHNLKFQCNKEYDKEAFWRMHAAELPEYNFRGNK